MNTLFNISHIIIFTLLIVLIIDMTACSISYIFKKTSIARINDLKRGVCIESGMYILLNIGYFFLGIILIGKGNLSMTSSELVIKIASRMHMASIAFIVAALIVTAVTLFCAATKEGNISELKKLLGNCITIAIIFWVLAWLIV